MQKVKNKQSKENMNQVKSVAASCQLSKEWAFCFSLPQGRNCPLTQAALRKREKKSRRNCKAPDVLELDTLCISQRWVCLVGCTKGKH